MQKQTVLFLFFVLLVHQTIAADSLPALSARIGRKDGKPVLEVSGNAPDASDWLAVTFFRPGEPDSTCQGQRTVYSVKGRFLLPVPIPAEYAQGSYEVGLWQRKLGDDELAVRPVGLKALGKGSVVSGAEKLRLADSLAALETQVGIRDGQRILTVSGNARDSRWLEVTFHRPATGSSAAESSKVLLLIPKGEFSPTIAVPAGFEAGEYSAALWARLGRERRSFRLEGALAVVSGQVGQ